MLIVLRRRAPRTKSITDRTLQGYILVDSSHCHDQAVNLNNKEDTNVNNLDLTDSTLRKDNDVIISSNGQDDSTVSFDDDESDGYAYFILHRSLYLHLFVLPSLLVQYQQFFVLLGCFFFFVFIIY